MSHNHENPAPPKWTDPEEEAAVLTVEELVEHHMNFVRERLADDVFHNVSPEAKEEFYREIEADLQKFFSSSFDHDQDGQITSAEIFGENGYFKPGTLEEVLVFERFNEWVGQIDERIAD